MQGGNAQRGNRKKENIVKRLLFWNIVNLRIMQGILKIYRV